MGVPELRSLMASTALQRVVSRAIYKEEYAQSLEECMSASLSEHAALQPPEQAAKAELEQQSFVVKVLLATHVAEVERLANADSGKLLSLLNALRQLKPQNNAPLTTAKAGSATDCDSPANLLAPQAFVCAQCGMLAGPPCKRCGRCRQAPYIYCSRQCQRLHWISHHQYNCHLAPQCVEIGASKGPDLTEYVQQYSPTNYSAD
eukprot:SAG31_NODE_6275_length_2093_cov_1.289368_1_plen_204_part_00